jgi:hypothetical protein
VSYHQRQYLATESRVASATRRDAGESPAGSVFKSPLGHPQWWYITLFRAPLEHADGPADACGLPTALTGPASRRGGQP